MISHCAIVNRVSPENHGTPGERARCDESTDISYATIEAMIPVGRPLLCAKSVIGVVVVVEDLVLKLHSMQK